MSRPLGLHSFEGFSLADVARLERLPVATVRSRARAGLKRLALSLDDLLVGGAEGPLQLEPQQEGCV
jgi:DNA-directed RNA polymerase specialized sigma24 family protein